MTGSVPRLCERARRATARRWLRLLALLACCAFAAQALAFQRDYYFQRVDSDNGLAQSSIRVLFQDARGYIWLGTQGGLFRWDGYHLRRYRHDALRADSLPDNIVSALADAGDGLLWVGSSHGGLSLFDPEHDRALPLAATVRHPVDAVDALQTLPDGSLLIADVRGIDRLTRNGADASAYALRNVWTATTGAPQRGLDFAGQGARAQGLALCPNGAAYAATVAGTLLLGDDAAHTRVLNPNAANAIACDARNRLLIGDRDGLAQIDRASGAATRLWSADALSAPRGVTAIAVDRGGAIWLSLPGAGLVRFDAAQAHLLQPRPELDGTLPETGIGRLLIDRSGLLWVGTFNSGAAFTDPAGAPFRSIVDLSPTRAQDSNHINTIAETSDGALWLGIGDSGLRRYDTATDTFTDFGDALRRAAPPAANAATSAANNVFVFAIAEDAQNELLLATNRGLLHFDTTAAAATHVAFADPALDALLDEGVRSVLRARNGDLWAAPLHRGLLHIRDGRVLRDYEDDASPQSLAGRAVLQIAEDKGGRIWAGTTNGVSLIDPASGRVRSFREVPGVADSLAGDAVASLHVGADGTVWVGTGSGLNRLLWINDKGAHFARYDERQGLPDDTVYCMLDDARNLLWFSTNLGIVRLDPRSGAVRVFGRGDGLQGDEYNSGACLRTRTGALLFGGVHGLDRVDPATVRASSFRAPVVVTAIHVGNDLLPAPARGATLDVPATARSLDVEFTALDYAASHLNRYRYRLVGYDDGWIDAGTRHYATYTNLAPGRYRFEARGSNRDGTFGGTATFAVDVQAPWWWSRGMQVLYAVLAALILVSLLLLWRNRHLEQRHHQRQLQLREDRLRMALWGSGDEFWDWDLRHDRMFRLGADGSAAGVQREESIAGEDWRNFAVHPDDLERVEHALAEHVAGDSDHFEVEHRLLDGAGEWIWVISRGKIVERDADGKPLRLCGTARDISALRSAERDRRIAAEVIHSMTEAVTVADLNFRFVSVNAAFTRMTGYGENEVLGRDSSLLNCRQHAPEIYTRLRQIVAETGHWHGEIWQRRKDGEEFLCWAEINEVRDASGERTHLVGVLSDITDRKRAEQELRYLANYDTLTGLPNRTLLGERLGHAIVNARRHGHKVAVLFLDLDRFKHVNDSMGHAAGDRMLKSAGARLRQYAREGDTVARLGGDEFTVVLEEVASVREAEDMAQRLIEAFALPLGLDNGQEVVISPSIGIALYPDHGQVPTDLLKYADTAMYQAKDRGRNTFAVYHARMDAQARDRARTIGALRRALERREFALVYQPKQALGDGRITGVEALLRWRSAELGDIPPTVFVPLAEETGQIAEIGEFVLTTACADLRRFREAGLRGLSMAVNLSAAQLERPELTQRLCEILAEHDIAPDQLELELTESMVMANAEQSVRILGELKSIGVHLAIDDFGTGYSSLAYLKRLPIDTLKIDKEFVGDITIDPDDAAITSTIIAMAHSLNLNVIAEGVETPEQLAFLRTQGCDEIQGHWLSVPLPADACRRFIAAHVERARADRERPLAGAGGPAI